MATDPPTPGPGLTPGTEVDHFRVMRPLGEGGMAEVYLARDTRLGRKVALKVVKPRALGSPENRERFLFEARATARFSHPHIVTIHAVGEFDGRPYVALEYLEGQTLRERMDQERLRYPEATRVALAVAEALAEAHAAGILHRDLKPANVMLGRDGRVRVLDFGLARALPPGRGAVDDEGDGAERAGDLERSQVEDPFESQHHGVRGTPAYMAPEQWSQAEITEAVDVWALGVLLFELVTGRRPFTAETRVELGAKILGDAPAPAIDPETGVPLELVDLVADCLRKPSAERPDARTVVRRLRDALQQDGEGLDGDESPFRGLLPFDERHQHVFFGRDAEIAGFVERLRTQPVMTVVGTSGAGKSSFVQAGIIPRLRERGPLVVLQLRPGRRPFRSLAGRIVATRRQGGASPGMTVFGVPAQPDGGAGVPETESGEAEWLADQLQGSPSLLNLVLQRLADRREASVVLFVDQLEELVTLEPDPAARLAFMQAICAAADDPQMPVRVVLTLREEFLSRLAEGPGVREALSQITVLRSPGPEALREIVARPVEAAGFAYDDPALVARMVDEVRDEAASLPLLQFTGQMLWERRDRARRLLSATAYEAVGGVAGALAQHADGVLAGLTTDEVRLARTMLLRLVTPEGTRRSMPRLRVLEGLDAGAEDVLKRLVGARLVTGKQSPDEDEGELELVHESLIGAWSQLSRWIDESHEERVFLGEIEQAAELWARRGCRDDEVWEGDALHEARRAASVCTSELSDTVRRFLAAGTKRHERAGRRRRYAVLAVVMGLMLVSMMTLLNAALAQRQRAAAEVARDDAQTAEQTARETLARFLAEKAAGTDAVHEATLYAIASLQEHENPTARGVLAGLVKRPSPTLAWQTRPGTHCTDLLFSPDGSRLVCSGLMDEVLVWDPDSGREVLRFGHDSNHAFCLAQSPDGALLATGNMDGEIQIYDAATGAQVSRLAGQRRTSVDLEFSPDGARIAAASIDGSVALWDVASSSEVARLHGHCLEHYGVAFHPDGALLATGCIGGDVLLWTPEADAPPVALGEHPLDVSGVVFLPDGDTLVSSSDDGTVVVWDVAQRRELRRFEGCPGRSGALDLLPDGQTISLGCVGGTVRLYDLETGTETLRVDAHVYHTSAVAIPPDGSRIATAGTEGAVALWDPATGAQQARLGGHHLWLRHLAISPDGDRVLSGGIAIDGDMAYRVWRTETGEELTTFMSQTGSHARFAPDGARVALAQDHKGGVVLVDTADGEELQRFSASGGRGWPLGFCDGGKTLLTAEDDHKAYLWDVESGEQRRVLPAEEGAEYWIQADGQCRHALSFENAGPAWIRDLRTGRRLVALGPEVPTWRVSAFSNDGDLVALGHADGTLQVHDVATGAVVAELEGAEGHFYEVTFSPNGAWIAGGGADKSVHLWDLATGGEIAELPHGARVRGLRFTPDGAGLVTIAGDATVRRWTLDPDPPSSVLFGHQRRVAELAFEEDGETLISAGLDGVARWWDVERGRETSHFTLPEQTVPVTTTRDGRYLLTSLPDGATEVWDLWTRARVGGLPPLDSKAQSATLYGEGRSMAVASYREGLQLWDLESGEARVVEIARDPRNMYKPLLVAISADEQRAAVVDSGQLILILELPSGRPLAQAQGPYLLDLAFSPDGRTLAGAGIDATVRLWSIPALDSPEGDLTPHEGVWNPSSKLPALTEVASLQGHDDMVTAVHFAPDGKRLVSAGGDQTVRVWDLVELHELATLPGYAPSGGVSFSPDSRWLATAQDDHTVRLWDTSVLALSVQELEEQVATDSGLVLEDHEVVTDPDRLETRFDPQHRATVVPRTDEEVRKWMESMPYPDADRFVASGEDDSGAEPAPEE